MIVPGGICCPQNTAPVEGTVRGRRPGDPDTYRRDSLITARRYGSFSSAAHSTMLSLSGIASFNSVLSFRSISGCVSTPYVAVTSVCAVLSVPASNSKSASPVSSCKVGVYCPFSRLGLSIVSKTVGKLPGAVGFFWSSTMRSRQNFERFQQLP